MNYPLLTNNVNAEIAFAPSAIQTRDVANAEFRYAKIIGQPFFSVGMVDLPAQGYKRQKNSRRMHMSFFVFKGKVTVTVGDNEFVVRKGGVWQVPRGKFKPQYCPLHSCGISLNCSTVLPLSCMHAAPSYLRAPCFSMRQFLFDIDVKCRCGRLYDGSSKYASHCCHVTLKGTQLLTLHCTNHIPTISRPAAPPRLAFQVVQTQGTSALVLGH